MGKSLPGVVRDTPHEDALEVGELEGAVPDVGHHVHEHGEHHDQQVSPLVAWSLPDRHLHTLYHVAGVHLREKEEKVICTNWKM